MRRAAAWLGAVALALGLATGPAAAAGPRLLIDRAELEPAWFPGTDRLRLHVTAVVLEGATIPLGAGDDVALTASGARRREPVLIGRFAGRGEGLAIALVVEVGWAYQGELGVVGEALGTLLGGLPGQAEVTLVTYGEGVEGGRRFEPPTAAARRLVALDADPGPGEPALLEAIERASVALAKLAPEGGAPLRRVIVVVSDGLDGDLDPARYRAAALRASKQGIRIHSLAFSPTDSRRPLLGLGELSKRSGGTFRWVRSREGFAPQIETLLDELGRQYVLTFFVPAGALDGKRVGIAFKELASNEVKLDTAACGAARCAAGEFCAARRCHDRTTGGRGLLGWLGWIVAGAGVLVVVGAGVSAILARRWGAAATAMNAAPPARPGPEAAPMTSPGPAAGAGRLQPVLPGGDGRLAPVVPGHGGPPQPTSPVAAPTATRPAALLIHAGAGAGRSLPLRHGFVIGTASSADLVIRDPYASAQHAQIVLDTSGGWVLVDRGSSNGTFVGGVRVREVRLTHGAAIRIGQTELRFLLG